MGFQEIFKVLLDGKDFGFKVEELAKKWEKFSAKVSSTELSFKIDQKSVASLEDNLSKQTAIIDKSVKQLNKSFTDKKPFNVKFKANDKDLAKKLTSSIAVAQKELDKSPLHVLENIQVRLNNTQAGEKNGIKEVLSGEKERIAKELGSIKSSLSTGFTKAFNAIQAPGETAQRIKLISSELKKMGKASSDVGKETAALKRFLAVLTEGLAAVKAVSSLPARIDFAKSAKGFSPAFLASLEKLLSLQKRINEGDGEVSKLEFSNASKHFAAIAQLEQRRINQKKTTTDTVKKITSDGEEEEFRIGEKGGKRILELVKKSNFKITNAKGTFRPAGEAVTDFSKAAEEALGRSKEFAVQAAQFKVGTNNPLHPTNIKKNTLLQKNLNNTVEEFLNLQEKIQGIKAKKEDLAFKRGVSEKKGSPITFSNAESTALVKAESELAALDKESLNLTAQLNKLRLQSLATEKLITAEIATQLRLNSENKKTFTDVSSKATARLKKISTLGAPVNELPNIPSAQVARDNFKELERVQAVAVAKGAEVNQASLDLRRAQNNKASETDIKEFNDTLKTKLGELRTADSDFEKITKQLPKQINKANADAQAEFSRIGKDAGEAATKATLASEQARTRVSAQEAKIRGLIARGEVTEVIKDHETLLEGLRTIAVHREQEEQEAQTRLGRIQEEGTLKKLQAAKLDVQPNVVKTTDNLSGLLDNFEQQLPKVRELILKRLDLERRGHALSLQATAAHNDEELRLITVAQESHKNAVINSEKDIDDARASIQAETLKDFTKVSDESLKRFAEEEATAIAFTQKRISTEQKELDAHNASIVKAETALQTELGEQTREQGEQQKRLLELEAALQKRSDADRVTAAKNVEAALLVVEEERLERIRIIEAAIAALRAHPPRQGSVTPTPGTPLDTPPVIVTKPVVPAATQKPITEAVTNLRLVNREFDKVNAKGNIFNEIAKGFEKNVGQSIGSVIKFQLAWRLAGPLISGALLPLTSIGAAIQTGIAYLQQFQERVVQIREVLLQNVRFSDDVATNFALGTTSAERLSRAVEIASTKVNTTTGVFEQVLESFVQSGGLQAVGGDLDKAVGSVALIIQDLGSVGISLKDARRAVSEVSKLLTEGVTARDALPRALKRSSDELGAIVRDAKESGNLFEVLTSLSSSQAKSLELSDKVFARLLDKVTLFLQRMSGAFSEGIFNAATEALQKIVASFESSGPAILAFASALGSSLGSILSTLTNIVSVFATVGDTFVAPFRNINASVRETETALDSLNRQITSKSKEQDVAIFGISPAALSRTVSAIDEIFNRIAGNVEGSNLSESTLTALASQRGELLDELGKTSVALIEKGREFEATTDASIRKQATKGAVPIFEERQKLLKKITAIDDKLKNAPINTSLVGVGANEFLDRTLGKPLRDALRTLPDEAKNLGASVGIAIDAGLADAEVAIQGRFALIKSDLEVFLSSIESNESRIREIADVKFSEGTFNEAEKAAELVDSLQRQIDDQLAELSANKKRAFGDVDDIQNFNNKLTESAATIDTLGKSIEKLKKQEVLLTLAVGDATEAERVVQQVRIVSINAQIKREEDALKAVQKVRDDLEKKRRVLPGLNKPSAEGEIEANELTNKAAKIIKDLRIAQDKVRHDQNLVVRRDREEVFKDNIDATKESLKQTEDLFKESSKVRVVDESESIKELASLRRVAIKQELNDIALEKKTASANTKPRQRQLITQANKLNRELIRLDELSAVQLNVALAKKAAFEEAFQDKRVEFQAEASAKILQAQIQDGLVLESAQIDQQERQILLRRVNAQEDLNRQIQIAKDADGAKFDESGDFRRKQIELDDRFTEELIANSQSRTVQLRKEAEALQQTAIERLKVEKAGLEQLIQLQELGITSDNNKLTVQLKLAGANKILADAELTLASAELNRLQLEQARLPIAQRNIALLERQASAVEQLRQAELRSAIDLRIAQNKKTQGIGSKLLEGLTGRDSIPAKSAREVLTERRDTAIANRNISVAFGIDPKIVRGFERTIKDLTNQLAGLGQSGLSKFGQTVLKVVNDLQGAVSAVIQGFQQGGIGGAVGAGLSQVGTIFQKALGNAGPIVQAAGAVVSLIASAFAAAARRLAQKIKKDFDKTLQTFRDEGASLGRTITSLEAQRISAIERLSGKKGGKKHLEELLIEFDDAIKDLVKSQKEIQDSFEDELGSLRLGNDALRDFSNAWDEVNKKVQAYVDSFRDGELTLEKQANAVEFLSLSLQKLQGELLDDLADAEKEAISNALALNDLFKERADLIKQMVRDQEEFNKAQFELLTADALETRVAGVVERGNSLVKLRQDFEDKKKESQERLVVLNAEIALKQIIFDKEKGIFGLTLDRTKLQQRNNVLEEGSLDRQIQKWKDIKAIIDGITRGPDGNFILSPALAGQISPRITTFNVGAPTVNVTINNPTGAPITPSQVTDPINNYFNGLARFGFQNS